VAINSAPAGLTVTVDGTSYATPQTFKWTPGSSHTLSTASPQGTGTRYQFANWSDGGAQSHSIVVPATATTYSASFTTQYQLTTTVSPSGAGTVTASPSSSDGYYNSGTSVQLTVTASGSKAFSGFSGALTGPANPQTVAMSAPRSVTANFAVPAKFSVSLKHSGAFTRGEANATYTVTVSDPSSTASSGAVTVVEALPAGMTLVSMAGTGWACSSGSATCTRSDSLAGAASYPAITVTVQIASNAATPLVNSVTVSGGGAATVTASNSAAISRSVPSGRSSVRDDLMGDRRNE
jgi:uncharacterized repeat protein (TIGR01451 family)